MKPEFISRFTLKQKIIALILCAVMIFTILGGTFWEVQRRETANASRLSDPLSDPADAFSTQEEILSKQASRWFIESQGKLQAGDYISALSLIEKAIEKDGPLALLLLQRAAAHVALQNYPSAIQDYSLVLDSYPDYTMLYQIRGALYAETDSPENAYRDYTRYLKDVPDDAESLIAHTNLALILGKYENALSNVEKLLLAEPQNGSLLALKGDIFTLLARPKDAIASYLASVKYLEGPTLQAVWAALGSLYQSGEDYEHAADAYLACLKENPASGEVWFQLGLCQIQTEAYDKAVDSFSHSLKLDYESDLSHFQRGLCYYALGKPEKAISDLRIYEKASTKAEASNAYIYLALSYTDAGNTDQAISYFQKCIDEDTMTSESHYYLGNLYLQLERYKDAVSHFTACIKKDFMTASCYYNRAVAYLELDALDEAQNDFRSVTKLNTDSQLTASAQNALQQIADAKQEAIDRQNAAIAAAQAEALRLEQEKAQKEQEEAAKNQENTTTNEKTYHTVIIKEGTLENPSAEINQSTEHTQVAE
ncbi:MAG: tetratricopeptide repeat protein [Erysipelotrichaceae bacterium]|nr:tetratricopeptide repeat protein [Erysipelotrichaceae bacterium]